VQKAVEFIVRQPETPKAACTLFFKVQAALYLPISAFPSPYATFLTRFCAAAAALPNLMQISIWLR